MSDTYKVVRGYRAIVISRITIARHFDARRSTERIAKDPETNAAPPAPKLQMSLGTRRKWVRGSMVTSGISIQPMKPHTFTIHCNTL